MNEILKRIIDCGFEAFIVGGYVRDYLLGFESNDIDICTNATIDQINNIFTDEGILNKKYYTYHIKKDNITYVITSYRKELEYCKNKPIKLEYAKDLQTDLLRRDFTINTIAMDINKNIIDLLNGKADLENRLIKVVGNTYDKFIQDKTRIIRAIRFYSTLDFELDDEIKKFLKRNSSYILDIPREYIKKELDKIFDNNNYIKFFNLVNEFNLSNYLNIKFNNNNIKPNCDRIEVWHSIETTLPLSNKEKNSRRKK